MYIYNTTFSVANTHISKWKKWLQQSYFPTVGSLMVTNGVEVFEVLTVNEEDSKTFSVQWRCMEPDHLDMVNKTSTEALQSIPVIFGEACLHFSSILQETIVE